MCLLFPTPKCPPHPQRVSWHSCLQKQARTGISKTVFFSANCIKKIFLLFSMKAISKWFNILDFNVISSSGPNVLPHHQHLCSLYKWYIWNGSIFKELLSIRSWIPFFLGWFNSLLLADLDSSYPYVPVTLWKIIWRKLWVTGKN